MVENLYFKKYVTKRIRTLTDFWDVKLETEYLNDIDKFLKTYIIPSISALPSLSDRLDFLEKAMVHYKTHSNSEYHKLADLLNEHIKNHNV